MQKEDMKWIRRIQRKNDRDSADQLIRKYYDDIYVFQYSHCRNMQDALDLTQETFTAVLRYLHTYDESRASFRTWLYHIAFRKYIDHTKTQSHIPLPDEFTEEQADPVDEEQIIQDRILLDRIDTAIHRLDPLLQEIWYLHLYSELTFEDIAAAVNLPVSNVKAKYYRLLKYIRRTYENEYRN